MKKKWIVIPSVLLLVIGTVATMPMWMNLWEEHGPQPKVAVDGAMRSEAIDTLIAKLNDHYVFPDKAKQIEATLRQRQREGKYDTITDGQQLAKQLTDDLEGIVHDHHLVVELDPELVPPDGAVRPPPDTLAQWERSAPLPVRLFRHVSKLGVEKVDHLSPRIGYLRITEFPPHFLMAEPYAAAMDKLADTDGLIVDLRENRGGDPKTVALLVSHFLDQRTRLNDLWSRDTNLSKQQWTVDKLEGKRYGGNKPVLILAGPGTRSAGEDFAYTMQALKRATVVGERTWGGAHPARMFRLGDHFYAVIPNRRAINPITQSNWEGVGVIPDMPAKPDNALAVATESMQRRLQGTAPLAAAGH